MCCEKRKREVSGFCQIRIIHYTAQWNVIANTCIIYFSCHENRKQSLWMQLAQDNVLYSPVKYYSRYHIFISKQSMKWEKCFLNLNLPFSSLQELHFSKLSWWSFGILPMTQKPKRTQKVHWRPADAWNEQAGFSAFRIIIFPTTNNNTSKNF